MKLKRRSNSKSITCTNKLGCGGEAAIYQVAEDPSLVAKIYHKSASICIDKLSAMLASPPQDPMSKRGGISIAWPQDLVWEPSSLEIVGFLMPRITGKRPVMDFYNPRVRREKCPFFNYRYLHATAYNIATTIGALHTRGYVIGDINESNVLVANTSRIALVDTDSFQVPDHKKGTLYRCRVGKPEFTPPELQGKSFSEVDRCIENDLFGLSVLIFQLLMEGIHPFAGVFTGEGDPPHYGPRIASGHFPYSNERTVPYTPMRAAPSFDIISPNLRKLFIRCFEKGHLKPQERPTTSLWQTELNRSQKELICCRNSEQHWYGKHLHTCPWCERKKQLDGRDPFPNKKALQAMRSTPKPKTGSILRQRRRTHVPVRRTHVPVRPSSISTNIPSYHPSVTQTPPRRTMSDMLKTAAWTVVLGAGLIFFIALISVSDPPSSSGGRYDTYDTNKEIQRSIDDSLRNMRREMEEKRRKDLEKLLDQFRKEEYNRYLQDLQTKQLQDGSGYQWKDREQLWEKSGYRRTLKLIKEPEDKDKKSNELWKEVEKIRKSDDDQGF